MRAPFKTKARTGVNRTLAFILAFCWLTATALITWLTALHQYELLQHAQEVLPDDLQYIGHLPRNLQGDGAPSLSEAGEPLLRFLMTHHFDNNGGTELLTYHSKLPWCRDRWYSLRYQVETAFFTNGTLLMDSSRSTLAGRYTTQEEWLAGEVSENYFWVDLTPEQTAAFRASPDAPDFLGYLFRLRGRMLENGRFEPVAIHHIEVYDKNLAKEFLQPPPPTSDESTENTVPDPWTEIFDTGETGDDLVTLYSEYFAVSLSGEPVTAFDGTDLRQLICSNPVGAFGNGGLPHVVLQDSLLELVSYSSRYYTDPDTGLLLQVRTLARSTPLLETLKLLWPLYLFSALAVLLLYRWASNRIHDNLVEPVAAAADCMTRDQDYIADEPLGWAEANTVYQGYSSARDTQQQLRNRITRLETALNYAEKAEEIRRQTTSALAHELKTPLAVVHSYAEGLQLGIAGEKTGFYLDTILRESEKMDALVMEMLDFSRLESGRVQIARDRVELGALTKGIFDKLLPLAAEKNLTVTLDWESEFHVTADEARLGQAVQNFASNAVKYTPEGGQITVALRKDRKEARLSVWNSLDAPLPEEVLTQVWEPFFRADESRTARGTGLGLAITKQIVQLHGGSVSARNMNNGIQFTMTLPL